MRRVIKMTYQVYNITNKDGMVVYVGVTKTSKGYQQRFWEHCYEALHSSRKGLLHQAMFDEGVDNFHVHLMFQDVPAEEASDYEIHWIAEYKTYYKDNPFGYNMTRGGHGVIGYEFTEEVRRKISKSSQELWNNYRLNSERLAARNGKISSALRGREKSPEHRKSLSQSRIGKYSGEENSFYGKHHTEDTKRHLSELRGKAVVMIDKDTDEPIKEFPSAKAANDYLIAIGATKNRTANGRILDICYGGGKTAYGYKWSFK